MARARHVKGGFTLVELLVVTVIVAILVGMLLPPYLAMRKRAQDTAAKVSATIAMTLARSLSNTNGFSVTTGDLNAAERSRTFVDGDAVSAGPTVVSQLVPDAGFGAEMFVAAVGSESGTCFFVRLFARGGVDYGEVDGAECRAENHESVVFGPSW